jgi:hypothetical protein
MACVRSRADDSRKQDFANISMIGRIGMHLAARIMRSVCILLKRFRGPGCARILVDDRCAPLLVTSAS